MKTKRILCVSLTTIMMSGTIPAITYADSAMGTIITGNSHIMISGMINTSDVQDLTLKIYDEDDKLAYIDQKQVKGDYKFECTINDISKQYRYVINCDGQVINDSVRSVEANQLIGYDIKFENLDGTRVNILFKNELGLTEYEIDNYVPIVACYSSDDRLISANVYKGGSFEFDKEKTTLTVLPPEGTAKMKAFLWNSSVNMKPLAEVAKTERKNVMVFFGDSITQNGFHQHFIEHYYNTRFPDEEIKYVNAGIGGTTASQGLNRVEWDVLSENPGRVFMMWGMNDGGISLYGNSDATEEEKQEKIDKCLQNIEELITIFKNNGIDVVLSTPSHYDEGNYNGITALSAPGYNSALGKIGNGIKALAKKYNLSIVDFWEFTNTVTNDSRTEKGSGMIITYPDRIHPQPAGGVAMAYKYIKDMKLPELVASVEIDATNGEKNIQNADVDVSEYSESKVKYSYLAKAIPLGMSDNYKKARNEFVGVDLDTINQEIIKITGLQDGSYEIRYDGNLVLSCTAQELAQGINIAENENNPAQIKAKQSLEYTDKTTISGLRANGSKRELYNLGILNDYEKIEEYITEHPDVTEKYNEYLELSRENDTYRSEAKKLAKPESYEIEIVKVD